MMSGLGQDRREALWPVEDRKMWRGQSHPDDATHGRLTVKSCEVIDGLGTEAKIVREPP